MPGVNQPVEFLVVSEAVEDIWKKAPIAKVIGRSAWPERAHVYGQYAMILFQAFEQGTVSAKWITNSEGEVKWKACGGTLFEGYEFHGIINCQLIISIVRNPRSRRGGFLPSGGLGLQSRVSASIQPGPALRTPIRPSML